MQSLDVLITMLCVVGAFGALVLALRNPQHRAALCFTALGALVAIPVTRALAPHVAQAPFVPPTVASPGPEQQGGASTIAPAFDEPSHAPLRRSGHSSAQRGGEVERTADAPRADEQGATEIAVRGSWEGVDLQSALLSALQDRGWSGLSRGGRNRLMVTGSVRDLEPILGQLSAASVSATWELRSASGGVLAQGAAADTRGRGTDESDARLAAVARAAAEIASQVVRGAP